MPRENCTAGLTFASGVMGADSLVTLGARDYDPRRALFTSPYPIIPALYNPQALNRFAYTYNKPLKYVDPSGHCGVWVGVDDANCSTGDPVADAAVMKHLAVGYAAEAEAGNDVIYMKHDNQYRARWKAYAPKTVLGDPRFPGLLEPVRESAVDHDNIRRWGPTVRNGGRSLAGSLALPTTIRYVAGNPTGCRDTRWGTTRRPPSSGSALPRCPGANAAPRHGPVSLGSGRTDGYCHDANGNQTVSNQQGNSTSRTWLLNNRPQEVRHNGTLVSTNVYDAEEKIASRHDATHYYRYAGLAFAS